MFNIIDYYNVVVIADRQTVELFTCLFINVTLFNNGLVVYNIDTICYSILALFLLYPNFLFISFNCIMY